MLPPQVGLRVMRGPDWKWGEEDGGNGWLGTINEIDVKPNKGSSQMKLVSVVWDFDNKISLYRVGVENAYDLYLYDSGPVGIKHTEFSCDTCEDKRFIIGTRYSCAECNNYDLCGGCYHNDKHNLAHSFYCIDMPDSPRQLLPPRSSSSKTSVKGFAVGAKVTRGLDWEWNSQDGGPKKSGRIIGILDGKQNESFRSSAKVLWTVGKENNYRMGIRGKVDLKCVSPGAIYSCYKEHLPVLGKSVSESESTQVFRKGDRVLLNVDAEELKFIQQQRERGGWNPYMVKFIGQAGTVHRVTEQGSVRIKFDDCDNKWTFDPRALCRVNGFCVGDYVRFIPDEQAAKEHLKGHGDWIENMKKDLGSVGCVTKVYEDKDVRVAFEKSTWTLSPKCLELIKRCIQHTREAILNEKGASTSQIRSAEERSNFSIYLSKMNTENPSNKAGSQCNVLNTLNPENFPDACNSCTEPSAPPVMNIAPPPLSVKIPPLYNPSVCVPLILEVMREMVEGNPQALEAFVAKYPDAIDCQVAGGKTLLHIAAYQGYIAQVNILIARGAQVHCPDETGDTGLHFAAYGNRFQVIELLIQAGARVDAQNNAGHTPLHVAVNKNFLNFVTELIKHGCNVNAQDNNQDTPLHDAIVRSSEEIQFVLINHPTVDMLIENATGFNVLNQAVLRGNVPAIEMILGKNVTLASVPKSSDGFTPLHVASCNGLVDIIKLLVEKYHVDIDAFDLKHKTPLFAAIARGHYNAIHFLVLAEASLTLQDVNGNTALHTLFIKRNSYQHPPNKMKEPQIHEEYSRVGGKQTENAPLIAVALFLISQGAPLDLLNLVGQKPMDLILEDTTLMNNMLQYGQGLVTETEENLITGITDMALTNSINSLDTSTPKSVPVECSVCSELGVANVLLRPCLHSVACEECSSRMKKCILCKTPIEVRYTTDGRVVASQERHEKSKIERVNYLESKINEIEEMNTCTICMERCRNTIFLCGHGTCETCANTLKYCHMCRKVIEQRINVFL